MKEKMIFAVVAVMAVISCYMAYTTQDKHSKPNALALANIEALSGEEDSPCPDYNYVPNHYLEVYNETVSVTCSREGEISFGSGTITGSFKKGNVYSIVIEVKNCSGESYGACCDQRRVGSSIISY